MSPVRHFEVWYCVGNWYRVKHVYTDSPEKAIKLSRIKNIVDVVEVKE